MTFKDILKESLLDVLGEAIGDEVKAFVAQEMANILSERRDEIVQAIKAAVDEALIEIIEGDVPEKLDS